MKEWPKQGSDYMEQIKNTNMPRSHKSEAVDPSMGLAKSMKPENNNADNPTTKVTDPSKDVPTERITETTQTPKSKKGYKQPVKKTRAPTPRPKELHIQASSAQILGGRDHQEDRFVVGYDIGKHRMLYAIMDGHRGSKCVDFICDFFPKEVARLHAKNGNVQQVLQKAASHAQDKWAIATLGSAAKRRVKNKAERQKVFAKLPPTFFEGENDSGTTLCACVIDKASRQLWVCHIGDSRFAMEQQGMIFETKDALVPDAWETSKGPWQDEVVIENGRVEGDVNMIAAIGDYTPDLLGVLIATPVCPNPISLQIGSTIVLGSDGFWDIVETQQLYRNPVGSAEQLLQHKWVKQYPTRWTDNVTVLVLHVV